MIAGFDNEWTGFARTEKREVAAEGKAYFTQQLKQKASEQKNADDYEDCNDDDFYQAHDHHLGRWNLTGVILMSAPERVNAFICKEL